MDCNECINLNLDEDEQREIQKTTGKLIEHFCKKYNKRVYHLSSNLSNHYKIIPCEECLSEEYHINL